MKYFYHFIRGCSIDIYDLNFRFWGSGRQDLRIIVKIEPVCVQVRTGRVDFGFGKGGNRYSYGKNNYEKNKNTKLSISF